MQVLPHFLGEIVPDGLIRLLYPAHGLNIRKSFAREIVVLGQALEQFRRAERELVKKRPISTAEIYRQIQTTATVDDILFSKAEQRAEQITADTRNDAVFTRKPTEPTR